MKGFLIEDTQACVKFLMKVNYYRLSAYFLPFKREDGSYIQGIPLKQIQRIYEFDSRIRALLFRIIEEIEFYLRTQFAYYSAHKYGALGYLDNKNFSERHNADIYKTRLETCIDENKRTFIVRHHMDKYEGKFPIWVIIEFFSIGMLSYFYNDMHSAEFITGHFRPCLNFRKVFHLQQNGKYLRRFWFRNSYIMMELGGIQQSCRS